MALRIFQNILKLARETSMSSETAPNRVEPELALRARAPDRHAAGNRAMFDRIAPTYDRVNRVLSLGTDRAWRERALAALDLGEGDAALDLCAGTLDLAALLERSFPQARIVACDASQAMLDRGASKVRRVERIVADALAQPFADATFAAVVCGFGMRNLADLRRGLGEVRRVLRPGGAFVTLELFKPEAVLSRTVHRAGLRWMLPLVGAAFSNDKHAYAYLAKSMDGFVTRRAYEAHLRDAGFTIVSSIDLTLGMASVVEAGRA
jgi:ubiquinone/menaquinone biosynthesis methyltransferase